MRSTSLEAWHGEIEPRLGPLQRKVLAAITSLGRCTDLELEAMLDDMKPATVRGRRIELVRMGLVEECGRGGDMKRHAWRLATPAQTQKELF